jgi:hypothetical protein
MVKSYVRLPVSRRAGRGEDELIEQEGAALEEGEAPLSCVLPPPREVEYVRVLQRDEWVRELEEETTEDVTEDCMTDDSLLYVKSLPTIVAALHRLMSL